MEGVAGAGDDAEAPCERRLPFARVVPAEGAGPGRAGRALPGRCGVPGGAGLYRGRSPPGAGSAAGGSRMSRPAARSGREAHTRGGGRVRPSGLRSPRRGAQAAPQASSGPRVPPACVRGCRPWGGPAQAA